MMHEHDFELIAAIAEGGMRPDEQAVAEASLASCEACSTDLQLQREGLAALGAAPPVMMTDLERTALHRKVAAGLTPVSTRSASRSTVPWFQRLMPAMAAAAALLVVVGVGSVLVTGDNNADSAAETTTVAGDPLRTTADEELAEATGGAEFDDGAALPTTSMASTAPTVSSIEEYGSISGPDLADIAKQLGSVEEDAVVNDYSSRALQSLTLDPALVCAEIALKEGMITAIGRAIVDGDDVEIYRIDDVVKVYFTADCSLMDPLD
jgi:hypothetical protein